MDCQRDGDIFDLQREFDKHEWVLKDDSVTYGDWKAIAPSLDYAFDREREFSYPDRQMRSASAISGAAGGTTPL